MPMHLQRRKAGLQQTRYNCRTVWENYDRVDLYYSRIEQLAPDLLTKFAYLNTGEDGSRGAYAGAFGNILFVEELE
ncbi:MAG: hypothetical protein DRP59_00745 [Spirochaetes bacterium]|nr:MAG: hypothetical protein DRP59_00745 [Spirochaetota bacterium]